MDLTSSAPFDHGRLLPTAILRIFPGISAAFFRSFFDHAGDRPLKGVVLETFGAGNAPESPGAFGVTYDSML